ncbi:hypothetical protein [Corynebacterium sp. MSK008]|uniref:hypothetical protein n=1 Tax=Corynebacterium sp. MSK008 TaxID=3050188 RepID=UPI00254F51FE|nr:hypothetical protein [Corynebacterium sp. MSK008]MDK8879532.1 hypothetical protein [Corynebacterium sp. MSK008]
MRKSLIAGVTAGALVLAGLNAPSATSQTKPAGTGITTEDAEVLRNTADAFEKLSESNSSSSEGSSSSTTDEKENTGPRKPGDPSPGLEGLNPDPENDPLYIDPEKNPLKKVSSSEMFLEWTDGMEEGDGKDFVQAWARNSSVPDTANPVELWKQEAQGSAMMSSGFFTGDFAQSSAGSSQATSVLIPVFLGMLVIGSVVELVMRGIRMAQQ